ncbi:hypothetical protein PHYPSEUDO_004051 [Phytophthora pseudosyringae]|uniref:Uncharacterized protein n=1 Tax=Phytophthora pseudosyringae TaxID=221518 RepID=A0A8T1VP61_9STRA|nr:hypothetical protein PHYPSEUDO_004051 [Phytophthora pseudosyringae]
MGVLFCTAFYDFGQTQMSVVLGVTFSTLMFLSMGQIPTYMTERDVFYKQRGASFFRTGWPYRRVKSRWLADVLPVRVRCGGEAVIIFELIRLLSNLVMGMWFFFLSAIGRNGDIATPLGMVSVLVFVIFVGFHRDQEPNPGLRHGGTLDQPNDVQSDGARDQPGPMDICVYDFVDYRTNYGLSLGEYYLCLFGMDTEKEWIVYGIIYTAVIYEVPENVDVSEKMVEDESYTMLETPKKKNATYAVMNNYVVKIGTARSTDGGVPEPVYSMPDPHNPNESAETK